jgi:hypothetical protein
LAAAAEELGDTATIRYRAPRSTGTDAAARGDAGARPRHLIGDRDAIVAAGHDPTPS